MAPKQKKSRGTAEPIPLLTTGKVFENGSALEPLRELTNPGRLCLLYWSGREATVGSEVQCHGQRYAPAPIDPTILRALTLPTGIAPHGSARKLLDEISRVMAEYTGLPENPIAAASRWILSTWFPELRPSPGLSLIGPDTTAGKQLFELLHCLCRHPLLLTEVTTAGLRALPMEWGLTLLIRQPQLSSGLQRLLSIGRKSVGFIPRGGRLLDLHCCAATYSELVAARGAGILPGLEISVISARHDLAVLDDGMRQKIANGFQPKLLAYRLATFLKVFNSAYAASGLTPPMQEFAKNLGACTPDDPDLQAQVPEFLRIQDKEMRSAA